MDHRYTMAIQIKTYSRQEFISKIFCHDDNVEDFVTDYFLCINASGNIHSIPYFKRCHFNVLNMYFDDVLEDGIKHYGPTDSEFEFHAKCCTLEQSKEMHNFIHSIPDGCNLHVYCTKGQSRSVAIAKYVDTYVNNIECTRTGYNLLIYKVLCSISK